jgi:ankyrin repeat protein
MPPKLELIVNHNRDLIDAGRHGELGRLRALLAGGADASARDEHGSTPLHAAASWNDRAVAQLLLDHGADVHARDWEGDTPLFIAAAFGDKAMIGLLLDRGADVNARDDTGWTPLHVAARLGRVEEVGFLLSRGADAGARNTDGHTPLEVALSNERLRDRREPLGKLLGEASRQAKARQNLPSPGDIAEDRGGPEAPGPERGKGRGR